jgi:hypothetical protein
MVPPSSYDAELYSEVDYNTTGRGGGMTQDEARFKRRVAWIGILTVIAVAVFWGAALSSC